MQYTTLVVIISLQNLLMWVLFCWVYPECITFSVTILKDNRDSVLRGISSSQRVFTPWKLVFVKTQLLQLLHYIPFQLSLKLWWQSCDNAVLLPRWYVRAKCTFITLLQISLTWLDNIYLKQVTHTHTFASDYSSSFSREVYTGSLFYKRSCLVVMSVICSCWLYRLLTLWSIWG